MKMNRAQRRAARRGGRAEKTDSAALRLIEDLRGAGAGFTWPAAELDVPHLGPAMGLQSCAATAFLDADVYVYVFESDGLLAAARTAEIKRGGAFVDEAGLGALICVEPTGTDADGTVATTRTAEIQAALKDVGA